MRRGRKARKPTLGKTFGYLTVIEVKPRLVELAGQKRSCWKCRCACGKEKWFLSWRLEVGKTTSCGCRRHDKVAAIFAAQREKVSAEAATPEAEGRRDARSVWRNMLDRCENPKEKMYRYYGKRGIKVCERWHDFEKFFADMGAPNGLWLERADNNKGYEPSNCRWATIKEQANNRRNNVLVVYKGKQERLSLLCDRLGIKKKGLVRNRIIVMGWSVEEALHTPALGKPLTS